MAVGSSMFYYTNPFIAPSLWKNLSNSQRSLSLLQLLMNLANLMHLQVSLLTPVNIQITPWYWNVLLILNSYKIINSYFIILTVSKQEDWENLTWLDFSHTTCLLAHELIWLGFKPPSLRQNRPSRWRKFNYNNKISSNLLMKILKFYRGLSSKVWFDEWLSLCTPILSLLQLLSNSQPCFSLLQLRLKPTNMAHPQVYCFSLSLTFKWLNGI